MRSPKLTRRLRTLASRLTVAPEMTRFFMAAPDLTWCWVDAETTPCAVERRTIGYMAALTTTRYSAIVGTTTSMVERASTTSGAAAGSTPASTVSRGPAARHRARSRDPGEEEPPHASVC